jgi:hypothetical protein
MGISLRGGSVGQTGVGSSTGDFERWLIIIIIIIIRIIINCNWVFTRWQ